MFLLLQHQHLRKLVSYFLDINMSQPSSILNHRIWSHGRVTCQTEMWTRCLFLHSTLTRDSKPPALAPASAVGWSWADRARYLCDGGTEFCPHRTSSAAGKKLTAVPAVPATLIGSPLTSAPAASRCCTALRTSRSCWIWSWSTRFSSRRAAVAFASKVSVEEPYIIVDNEGCSH